MRGKLFTLASMLSLLLSVATAVLWVRSYRVGEAVSWDWWTVGPDFAHEHMLSIGSGSGAVALNWCSWRYAKYDGSSASFRYRRDPYPQYGAQSLFYFKWATLGFELVRAEDQFVWLVPDYAVLLLACLLLLLLHRRVLFARGRPGHCRQCGYDLRATPDRCPECGTPSGTAPQKATA